ncbi:MAG TPA: hypothetical protein VHC70_13600, partial [Phycisphaerales bacterium]|nr:hypothetical protein [Phycisphaerales bacterium]
YALARAYTGTKKFEDQVKENVNGMPAGFVASGPGAAIHIFSDGRLPDAERVQTAPEDRVVYHAVGGQDSPNIAIIGLRAERAFDNPARVNVFISLQSTDTAPRNIDAELTIDGEPQSLKSIHVAAATQPVGTDSAKVDAPAGTDPKDQLPPLKPRLVPGLGGVVFPVERMTGGVAMVRIMPSERDALSTDNTGYLTIPPAKRLSVVLVTNGNLFIKSALDGLNLSKFDIKSPEQFQQMLDKGEGGGLAQYDVFIFDRVLPTVTLPDKSRGPGLPPGRSLVLGAVPPPPLGLIDEGPGKAEVIAAYDRDHPVLRLAGLDKINVAKTRKVKIAPDTPVKKIAEFTEGPAIVEITDANLQAIVVPWDVADSDWPFDPGWVLFLAGSVLHLSDTQAGVLSEGIRAGDTLTTRLPPGSDHIRLLMPGNDSVNLEQGPDGTVSFGPIARTGMYTVAWEGQASPIDVADGASVRRNVAVNLLDPYESDIGAVPRLAMAREEVQAQDERESDLTRKLWPYLLLGALGVMMLEWFIYNRKVAL